MPQSLPFVANANLVSPFSGDNPISGSPTIWPGALSQNANSSVSVTNSDLAHACAVSGNVKYAIAWTSLQVKELIESIRTAIQGIWGGVSGSPFGNEVALVINAIKAKVKQIQKLVAKVQEVAGVIKTYVSELQQLLAYIASLPARIANLLASCLSQITSSIKDAIVNAKTIVTSQSSANTILSTASSSLDTANTTSASSSGALPMQKT